MSRYHFVLVALIAFGSLTSGGCRSCSSCHDYDPPVANCECNASGCHRAGSASGGYASDGYPVGEYEYVVEPPMEEPAVEQGRVTGSR